MLHKSTILIVILFVVYSFVEAAPPSPQGEFVASDCAKEVQDSKRSCFAAFPVFHWNHEKQECEPAFYGGCHGTRNRFETLEACQTTAGKICKT